MNKDEVKKQWKKEINEHWIQVQVMEGAIRWQEEDAKELCKKLRETHARIRRSRNELKAFAGTDIDGIVRKTFISHMSCPKDLSERNSAMTDKWYAKAQSSIPARISDIPEPLLKEFAHHARTNPYGNRCSNIDLGLRAAVLESVRDPELFSYLEGVEEEIAAARKHRNKPKKQEINVDHQPVNSVSIP